MNEIERFSDANDWYGLRSWRNPEKSRLLNRLKELRPRPTITPRRGFLLLRDLLGERVEELPPIELEYAYERLLILDWSTGFKVLGFFTEEEVRAHARLSGPPVESVLGHFWYGLLGGENLRDVVRILRHREPISTGFISGFGEPKDRPKV